MNDEQHFVLDALTDPKIKLVTITGKAGTGKTLLAAAAGLTQVLDSNFRKLVIARPIMPMGNDIGFLPGSKDDKLAVWMQPLFDNLEFMAEDRPNEKGVYSIEDMMEEGILQLEALTYIRGRTFHNQFLIIDEAQNLSALEIKTIITRAGDNTKIVLTGDTEQIDSPHLDAHNNGLSLVVDRFKSFGLAAHIHLEKCERSELAEFAAENL
jgi:PhoH-like ATPase